MQRQSNIEHDESRQMMRCVSRVGDMSFSGPAGASRNILVYADGRPHHIPIDAQWADEIEAMLARRVAKEEQSSMSQEKLIYKSR